MPWEMLKTMDDFKRSLMESGRVWRCHLCSAPWIVHGPFQGGEVWHQDVWLPICLKHLEREATRCRTRAQLTMPQPWPPVQRLLDGGDAVFEMVRRCGLRDPEVSTILSHGVLGLAIKTEVAKADYDTQRIQAVLAEHGVGQFWLKTNPFRNPRLVCVRLQFDLP